MKRPTEHTQGPWHDAGGAIYGTVIRDDRGGIHKGSESMVKLAEISRPRFSWEPDNTEANARLMAAAPALLEALQWATPRVGGRGSFKNYLMCLDAIAAATTRDPVTMRRGDPFDEAHELYTHGATSGIADGDDNHITE
jgi:hypothetical protein